MGCARNDVQEGISPANRAIASASVEAAARSLFLALLHIGFTDETSDLQTALDLIDARINRAKARTAGLPA